MHNLTATRQTFSQDLTFLGHPASLSKSWVNYGLQPSCPHQRKREGGEKSGDQDRSLPGSFEEKKNLVSSGLRRRQRGYPCEGDRDWQWTQMSGRTEFGEDARWRVRERMRESGRERWGRERERESGRRGRGRESEWVVVGGGGGKRMNTPMLIGDGTSVLMYVFLVCCVRLASPPSAALHWPISATRPLSSSPI